MCAGVFLALVFGGTGVASARPTGNLVGARLTLDGIAGVKPRYLGDGRALRFDPDPKTNRVTQIGMGGHGLAISTGRC